MTTIKVLRGNTSSIANYAGQAGEVALNYETGNLAFWTNTANTYYTLAREGAAAPIYTPLQGSTSGYSAGGANPPSTPTYTNIIDKFPFSSDTSSTDIANLTTVKLGMAGQKGSTHGYLSGGTVDIPTQGSDDQIQKFSFTSDSDAVNIGTLTSSRHYTSGQSSLTHGYTSGGLNWVATPSLVITWIDTIDKFPFSSDTNASDVGELTVTGGGPGVAGGSSQTHGYVVGGSNPAFLVRDAIQKFSFSSDSSSIDVGEIGVDHPEAMAVSSSTNIYITGSAATGPVTAVYKAPFISDTSATEVLALAAESKRGGGASSTTDGYFLGGQQTSTPSVDFIQKFPFSSDTDAVDIGEIVLARFWTTGNQT